MEIRNSDFSLKHKKELTELSESLFITICQELHAAGLSPSEIAQTINQVFEEDSKLLYCSEEEVSDALK